MTKRIIVRAPNWLGDAIMSTPLIKRLVALNPGASVNVLCRPALAPLYETLPGIRRVLVLEKGGALWALSKRLRTEEYDTAYCLPPSFSSALLFFLAGIPERIGYAADFRSPLLTKAFPLDERYHYVRRYLGLIGEEGREVSQDDLFFPESLSSRTPTSGHAQNACPPLRRGVAISTLKVGIAAVAALPRNDNFKMPILAVAPGSRASARRWFPERFAELINDISKSDWPTIALLGAPDDAPFAREVECLCRRPVVNLCGKTSLVELGEFLRLCAALVTNESGLMHVAWAVGTPTVVLAGPSEPRVTSPFGARVKILQHREIPCVPCVKNDCYRLGQDHKACLKALKGNEVLKALECVLTAPPPARTTS